MAWTLRLAVLLGCVLFGCSSGNGNGDGNGGVDADGELDGSGDEGGESFVMYIDTSALVDTLVTFMRGRCVAKVSISSQTPDAQQAAEAFVRHLAESIPLDGSAPAGDRELVGLVPVPPLAGELSGWVEDTSDGVEGPYLITSDAYEWINGAAAPFQDNGFEAVVMEYYRHETEGWSLNLDLVNMGSLAGAQAAFEQAQWNSGTQIEGM